MPRILPLFCTAIAACAPSPQESAMPHRDPLPATVARAGGGETARPAAGGQGTGARASAAQDAAAAPGSSKRTSPRDLSMEGEGRRTLSTAFVMVGPDGHLTVELRDGRLLVLRDVVMRRDDYCGMQVLGDRTGDRFCAGYADVAAARAGGGPVSHGPASLDPVGSGEEPARRG